MLKYSDEVIKFEKNGVKCEVAFPKAKQLRVYEEGIAAILTGTSKASYSDVQRDYLMSLGMPEEMFDDLLQKQIYDLLEYLNGQKKISN